MVLYTSPYTIKLHRMKRELIFYSGVYNYEFINNLKIHINAIFNSMPHHQTTYMIHREYGQFNINSLSPSDAYMSKSMSSLL